MVNVTELFVLVNATWSALHLDNVNVDPVTERIAREVDAIMLDGGCPLNCCNSNQTVLAYTGAKKDKVPEECKEAAQIQRCTSIWGSENEDVCIDIVVETPRDALRHNKRAIRKAADAKRAALERRLDFLMDDVAKAIEDFNVADAAVIKNDGSGAV